MNVEQTQYGNRFKAVNPQYANQPQQQPQPTQLTPAVQQQINAARSPQQAAQQIMDTMGGTATVTPPNPDRERVLGMCFTNLLAGRLAAVCPTEMEKDLGVIAAIWRLAAVCIDGGILHPTPPRFQERNRRWLTWRGTGSVPPASRGPIRPASPWPAGRPCRCGHWPRRLPSYHMLW